MPTPENQWRPLAPLTYVKGPPGDAGASATITIAGTTTGAPGTPADVTNSGSSLNAELNFTIPAGQDFDPANEQQVVAIQIYG